MSDTSESIKLYEVPENQRYWVVRCNGGLYFDHFLKYSIIAIGHLDSSQTRDSLQEPFYPDISDIEKYFNELEKAKEISKASSTSSVNQIRNFIHEMQIGDLVLTIEYNRIAVGRITGHPRFNREDLEIVYDKEKDIRTVMESYLRRKVIWGPIIKRDELPYAIYKSLRANQTVFNLDDHWEAIHHVLYPIFKYESTVYFSAKISNEESINNFYVSQFLLLLSETEVIAKKFDDIHENKDFRHVFNEAISNNELTLSTKAQFMSPGDIWGTLSLVGPEYLKHLFTFVFGYSALFGSKLIGWEGILDIQTRHKIRDIIIARASARKANSIKGVLDLRLPQHDTLRLEDNSEDEV